MGYSNYKKAPATEEQMEFVLVENLGTIGDETGKHCVVQFGHWKKGNTSYSDKVYVKPRYIDKTSGEIKEGRGGYGIEMDTLPELVEILNNFLYS